MTPDLLGGAALLGATIVALALANSPLSDEYADVLAHRVGLGPDALHLAEPLGAWVNDGLMAVFFFVVGLEINRELTTGSLRNRRTATLPVVAALGGMVVPACVYLLFAGSAGGEAGRGWGIPMATDIAFVLGVVALLGPRVPPALRLFLLTAAVADDLGAIAVIAVFYADDLSLGWLAAAAAVLGTVVLARRRALWSRGPTGWQHVPFVCLGVALWYCTFRSGVHATVAGVAMGFLTPARPPVPGELGLAQRLEHRLDPWSTFVVLPLFALANAGVSLDGAGDHLTRPVAAGVFVGLVVGKTVGVGGTAWLARRVGIGALPSDITGRHLLGGALLAGIGFTVSLFVTELAFADPALQQQAKVAILAASLVAAIAGSTVLATATVVSDPARRR